MTSVAASIAANTMSTETPRFTKPNESGGATWMSATSMGMRRLRRLAHVGSDEERVVAEPVAVARSHVRRRTRTDERDGKRKQMTTKPKVVVPGGGLVGSKAPSGCDTVSVALHPPR